jgi:hypothetical protein
MSTKFIDAYEVEFSAEPLEGTDLWGAYVAVYAPSSNPMHRNNLVRKHRVAAVQQFTDKGAAHAAAETAAEELVASLQGTPANKPAT